MTAFLATLLCVIKLSGVTGTELRARAFFDANNVKVGDPMVLTIDFLGTAEFRDLHPPALSRIVNRKDWKVDDASAKTETFEDARRLVYRVRPMREGVLWFPALEFACEAANGGELKFRANDIPVHAKLGAQVAMNDIGGSEAESEERNGEDEGGVVLLKRPEDLGVAIAIDDDTRFQWNRALAKPTAESFAALGFAAARYNEAMCEIRAGNWAKAMGIFLRLEWQVGQTPAIERGIVAALRLRYDNPEAELPMWRVVFRPILKYSWMGRVSIGLGGFIAVALVFWLLGRGIRAVAALILALMLVLPAGAQDIFRQMEERMQRMQREMQQSFGGFGGFGGGFQMAGGSEAARKVTATLSIDKPEIQVGEPFNFIITLVYPRSSSVGQIQLTPSERFGIAFTGQAQNLVDGKSGNISNVVKRLAIPARYDVPYRGKMAFTIEGMISGRESRNSGRFSFTFSNSFSCNTQQLDIKVKPLDSAGQPADFSGIVADSLRFIEARDLTEVESNDVISITYSIMVNGFLPKDFMPKGSAFELGRHDRQGGGSTTAEFRRYFVADGSVTTPVVTISYYDIKSKKYKVANAGGAKIIYKTNCDNKGVKHVKDN